MSVFLPPGRLLVELLVAELDRQPHPSESDRSERIRAIRAALIWLRFEAERAHHTDVVEAIDAALAGE